MDIHPSIVVYKKGLGSCIMSSLLASLGRQDAYLMDTTSQCVEGTTKDSQRRKPRKASKRNYLWHSHGW